MSHQIKLEIYLFKWILINKISTFPRKFDNYDNIRDNHAINAI